MSIGRCASGDLINFTNTGDPGVGKTAIADGLALRIISGHVPESLIARVFSLDLGALLASTACKSAYEQVRHKKMDAVNTKSGQSRLFNLYWRVRLGQQLLSCCI